MNLNPIDLKYFYEAASNLNLSRAAERLGVGQPTVSQAIKRLEQVFGVKLFDRYKTGVRLTTAGKRLQEKGRIFLEHFENLKEEVLASEIQIAGRYSMGCHVSVGLFALPAFLKTLMTEYPGLEIELSHGLSREMVEDVISFRVDFGIVVNPVRHPDLIIKELRKDSQTYWSRSDANTEVLLCDSRSTQSQMILSKTNPKELHFKRRIESSSLELLAGMAEAGCGVAILPESVAKRFPALKRFKPGLPVYEDRICLVYRADRKNSAAFRVIVDLIAQTKM